MKKRKIWQLPFGLAVGLLLVLTTYLVYLFVPVNSGQLRIGVTYMTMNNDFYKTLNEEIEKVTDEKGDILYTRDPALNASKQSQQVQSFIDKKVDMIIINPVNSQNKSILKALRKAKKAGIKIVVVDSQIKDSKLADVTVISDNYEAGVLCAQNLMQVKSSANILLLEHRHTISADQRIQGFLDTISSNANYQVVQRLNSLGQTEIALPQVEEVIDQGKNFDVVMALNDQAALGALAAIKEKGLSDKIYIYGVDGSPNMKSLLASSTDVQATVAQSPVTMGKKAIQAGYRLCQGKSVKSKIIVPVTLLTTDTIADVDVTGWQ